jgi:uncharacterized membrane protein YsdA (DUF1294 family)
MVRAALANESTMAGNSTSSCIVDFDVPNVLLIVAGSAAALTNGLLLLVLYNERKKFFRTRVSYLIANLAVADCCTGLMLVLVMVLNMVRKEDALDCYQFLFLCGSIQCSFYTLILMSGDRLIVAVMPMTWSHVLTKRNTLISIIFAWALAIFGSIMMRYHTKKHRFAFLLFLEITAVLFIFIHVIIFHVLRRQRRDLSQRSGSSAEIATIMDLTLQACHAQITSVVLTLMMVLIVAYTPYVVYSNILLVRQGTGMGIRICDNVFLYIQAISYLNYAANPIVYAWRLRVYRKALFSLILRINIS